jgi:hypothetical protein
MFIFTSTNEGEKMNMGDAAMPAKVWKKPIDVGNRLEKLFGLKKEQLVEIVEAMVRAKADWTPNDPPGSRGWSAYKMGTRRLREVTLTEKGWEKDDTDQIPGVINKVRGVRLVVANTDDVTGMEEDGRNPQNRSKKGAATDRVVHANQLSFMKALDESLNVVPLKKAPNSPDRIITWYLCTYCEGEEFRAELSCPNVLEDGYFADFYERIFLTDDDGSDGGEAVRRSDDGDDSSGFEIPVTRKKK